ncbi:hypothetical protein [Nocardia terpenica]|uniref:hypothetical protein n=1 Tax=Nocardia terpenica TaxID=455432 RepID=UPI0012FE1FAA|nr:hypothetical protein [Nocardia terpenica]
MQTDTVEVAAWWRTAGMNVPGGPAVARVVHSSGLCLALAVLAADPGETPL